MSRYIGREMDSTVILEAASHWKEVALESDGSVFSNLNLWTIQGLEAMETYYTNQLNTGEGNFLDKLNEQLNPTSPEIKKLASEMLWLMLLCPSNIGQQSKNDTIRTIWGWSGDALPNTATPWLSENVLAGIGSSGPGFNNHRWRELVFFINVMLTFKRLPNARKLDLLNDSWAFATWLNGISGADVRQLRHMLLFLLFPDSFERIFSPKHKKNIVTTFTRQPAVQLQGLLEIDKTLFRIRNELVGEYGIDELDYYEQPLYSRWHAPQPNTTTPLQPPSPPSNLPLNQILFGPPGTGKTYATINETLRILDPVFLMQHSTERVVLKRRFDNLISAGHVRFVTFHQSFSYEDFVEGIRAESLDGGLNYSVKDGVFKILCNEASSEVNLASATTAFTVGDRFNSGYIVRRITPDILELEKPDGKTFALSVSLLQCLSDYVGNGNITLSDISKKAVFKKISDHKLDPHLVNGYNAIIKSLVERLSEVNSSPLLSQAKSNAKVLIIDEINRGNISRIFGELITLIEPSKRSGANEALEVTLPYSKKPFSVPGNVFLIGTMNTADRSLTGLDVALRRRFTFKEMPPQPQLLDEVNIGDVNIGAVLRKMNERIEVLLDRDHCLGHAYFMPLEDDNSPANLKFIFRQQILPLLQEYFFEDWERIAWVLNCQNSNVHQAFIENTSADLSSLFGADIANSLQNVVGRWRINEDAFSNIECYRNIIGVAP